MSTRKPLSGRVMRDRKQEIPNCGELRYAVSMHSNGLHVVDTSVFRVGDLIRPGDSYEVMLVDFVSACTDRIWVTRGYGNTQRSGAVSSTKLHILGNAAIEERINSASPISAGAGSSESTGAPGSASIADTPSPKASDLVRSAVMSGKIAGELVHAYQLSHLKPETSAHDIACATAAMLLDGMTGSIDGPIDMVSKTQSFLQQVAESLHSVWTDIDALAMDAEYGIPDGKQPHHHTLPRSIVAFIENFYEKKINELPLARIGMGENTVEIGGGS